MDKEKMKETLQEKQISETLKMKVTKLLAKAEIIHDIVLNLECDFERILKDEDEDDDDERNEHLIE